MNTTPNTTASAAADALRSAMNRAFNLGQIYLQQADSDSYAEQDESRRTYKKYKALLEETCTTLAASAPVAPAHQPAPMPYPTDAQVDAVYEQTMSQHLRSQDAPAVRRFGRAMFLCAWNAAAPKTDPAINKVSTIIDAYGMTPGEPERVADIPGLAEALEAAFADGSAQVTGATPSEYLPLQGLAAYLRAEAVGVTGVPRETLRSWANEVDAAARGAAQPEGGA